MTIGPDGLLHSSLPVQLPNVTYTPNDPIGAVRGYFSDPWGALEDFGTAVLGGISGVGTAAEAWIAEQKQQIYQQNIQAGASPAQAWAAANEWEQTLVSVGIPDQVTSAGQQTANTIGSVLPSRGTLFGLGIGTIVILLLIAYILHEIG